MTKNEYEHARIVAAAAKKPLDEVIETMTKARDAYGVSFRNYHNIHLYNHTTKTISNQGKKLQAKEELDAQHYRNVCKATGLTKAQVKQALMIYNDNPYTKVDIAQYDELKLYEHPWNMQKQLLIAIRDRRALFSSLSKSLMQIDQGNESYESIKLQLKAFYENTEATLLLSEMDDLAGSIEKVDSSALENEELFRKIATDLIVCKRLLGFLEFEYVMFDLWHKSFEEKRTYVSNSFRMKKVSKVNDRIKADIFDNKSLTYEIFKEFYHREVISICSDDDYEIFEAFCKKHPKFVKKPSAGTMGAGVGLVETDSRTDLKELFQSLREEMIEFLCEELIVCHPDMKRFNPDSVNTIRLTTYHDGKKTHIVWPWAKVGRAGSFVDNAGSGGLSVAIDIESGKLISYGVDEYGCIYDEHPDNHLVFRGYQLPNWQGALELGNAISEKLVNTIDGVRFVGWDITYTEDNRWIVIEGNTFPQLVEQATYGRGFRRELDELIK